MAIEIIKDMGARLLIEKDGIRSVVSSEMFDQLMAQEDGGTDIASTRNLPSLAPVPEPKFVPAPPPISGELGGSPQFQKENEPATLTPVLPLPTDKPGAVTNTAPATITPVLKTTDAPDAITGGPVDTSSLGSTPPVAPTSTKSITRGEYNASIRDATTANIATATKSSILDQEDAAKVLAVKEAEDVALSNAEAERTQQREEEATERRENYEDKKRMVKEFQDTKITESSVFSMKTTLQIISAGIGNIINLRAGRAQDPMAGFKIIENAIDRDLQMQMKNLDKKGKDIDAQGGLIAEFRGLTGDNESAYALAKATMIDTAKRKVDMVASRSKEERAKLGLEALGTKLGEDRDALLMANAAAETTELDRAKNTGIAAMNAKTRRLSQKETARANAAGEKFNEKKLALANRVVVNKGEYVLDTLTGKTIGKSIYGEKGAKELSRRNAEYEVYRDLGEKYERTLISCGDSGLTEGAWNVAKQHSKCKTQLDVIQKEIVISKAKMNNPDGRLSDADIKIAEGSIIGRNSIATQKNPLIAIRYQMSKADKDMKKEFRRHGITDWVPGANRGTPSSKKKEAELTPSQKLLKDSSAVPHKTLWTRDPANEDTTARWGSLEKLVVAAKRGDKEAKSTLEFMSKNQSKPKDAERATKALVVINKNKELEEGSPGSKFRDDGTRITDKVQDKDGKTVGSVLYTKDGSISNVADYWEGTKKLKSNIIYSKGVPSMKITYSKNGKFLKKERL